MQNDEPVNQPTSENEEDYPTESQSAIPEVVIDPLELEVRRLRESSDEFKDKYMRGLAESENLRKRMQKEKQDLMQYAVQNIINDFLTPIDHFENALKFTEQSSDDVKHWAIGFQMILNQFKDVLAANGVTPFVSVGQPFDHTRHEAIEMVETTEFSPGTVVEESLRGYKINSDRILRPARVKVAKAPASNETIAELNEEIN
ncbi:MAG: nucleotide exchange factor GrpE [Parachlamydiaceae bacterium]|nr:nucleotide exchange factor GrpE [Parachlamydiaceae bacterium]